MIVYFVGAGPGDLELLTIKAKKIIQSADIIIYAGSLVNPGILKFKKKAARVYDSGKMDLGQVLGVLDKEKATKKIIARVHSGDPSIYGAIQEQISWCEKENIAHAVIPGVSSFAAAAATLRQELTLPGVSQTIIITRVSGRTKVPKKENLRLIAKIRATLVLFLSVDKINQVVKELLFGYNGNTPVAVVFKASWPDEKRITGRLKDIADKVKKEKIGKQALIIVGDVLSRSNFKKSKLYDKNFLHAYRKDNNENCYSYG